MQGTTIIWWINASVLFGSLTLRLAAQGDSIRVPAAEWMVSGFFEGFYVYDFNQPKSQKRQDFLFNHNRHHAFRLNSGMLQIAWTGARFRGHLALHQGTFVEDNYASEPVGLSNLQEAHLGVSLSRNHSFWLDAGILPSHIGFESVNTLENWTLTRSILAENSPYFFTGFKLSCQSQEVFEWALLLVNGWQRIQGLPGNTLPSFGTQLLVNPSAKLSLNWSTFLGTNDPDSTRRMRFFNNFWAKWRFSDKLGLTLGFDLGMQQQAINQPDFNFWFSPVVLAQYSFNQRWNAACRAEYYQDDAGVVVPTESQAAFRTMGFSLNIDYSPIPQVLCRLEGRCFLSENEVFKSNGQASNRNFFVGSSFSFAFSERWRR